MKPNRSILQCPDCEKPLIGIGSKVARIHPVAKFVRDHPMTIVLTFDLAILLGVVFMASIEAPGGQNLGIGFLALFLAPFIANFFLLRFFPIYRITDCPYCGFHEKQKLGLSESGEL